jgi:hypothetical protein
MAPPSDVPMMSLGSCGCNVVPQPTNAKIEAVRAAYLNTGGIKVTGSHLQAIIRAIASTPVTICCYNANAVRKPTIDQFSPCRAFAGNARIQGMSGRTSSPFAMSRYSQEET